MEVIENILQNEKHYAKVDAEREERRAEQSAAMFNWFWAGVFLALLATAALVITYMMRHPVNVG